MPDSPATVNEWARSLTLLGAVLVFIWAGWKRVIVWGYQLTEERTERIREREECEKRLVKAEEEAKRWQDLSQTNKAQLDRLLALFEQRRSRP